MKDFPTQVIIYFNHNHSSDSAEALKFRQPSSEVKEAFLKHFLSGLTPAKAYHLYNSELQEHYKDKYYVANADRAICPDIKWVYYLYYQIFKKEYGHSSGKDMLSSLESFISKYNTQHNGEFIKLKVTDDDNFCIVILTAFMRRVLNEIPQSGEILFSDSTGNVDRFGCKTFLLLTNSCCGGLPIGIIITTSEKEEILTMAFDMYRSFLDDNAFGSRGHLGPQIIMTDDSKSERNSFSNVFPNATLLLCIFHILQAAWRYLCSSQSEVPLDKRQDIFFDLKKLMYIDNKDDFNEMYKKISEKAYISDYPKIARYLENLYTRKEEWALCFRKHLILRGQNTNNICEAAMRVLKDHTLQRKKAYSVVQLVDILVSELENFYYRKVISIANGRPPSYLSKKLFDSKEIENLYATQLSMKTFKVFNNSSKGEYLVDIEIGLCTCPVGQSGQLCKHQYFICMQFHVDHLLSPALVTPEMRKKLLYVACGTNDIPSNWFAPLVEEVSKINPTKSLSEIESTDSSLLLENNEINTVMISPKLDVKDFSANTDNGNAEEMKDNEDYNKNKTEILSKLDSIFNDIKNKIENNDIIYTAAKKFIKNYENIKTEAALETALTTFGKYSGFDAKRRIKRPISNTSIGVQPTAISRRKVPCGGRNCIPSGRPPKRSFTSEHGYFKEMQKSTLLPKKQKKSAPHNITYCTNENISLGKTH